MHVLDLASGKVRSAGGEGFSASWSRDGRIALVVPRNFPRGLGAIQIRRIVGSHVTDRWLDTGTDGYDSSPSWSPDGTRLAFATRLNGEWKLSIINADGSHRRLLARHASLPAWSPDGKLIAYKSRCGVELITPSGRDATADTGCHSFGMWSPPSWSPDGKWIAISRKDGPPTFSGGTGLYVVQRGARDGSFRPAGSSNLQGDGAPIAWQPIPRAR
jgi:TolB protein